MPTLNNILNVRVNQVQAASAMNYGDTVNIGATSDAKTLGGSQPIGDFPRNIDLEGNMYFDPDVFDQSGSGGA